MSYVSAATLVEGARAERTAYVLHGILGSGLNWRSFCVRLAGRLPRWRFVLADLRNHGASRGAAPPHTLEACADDLAALARVHGEPAALIGHSFGGKLALVGARRKPKGLDQVWTLDANPDPLDPTQAVGTDQVLRVLGVVRDTPLPIPNRQDVIVRFVEAGLGRGIGAWMTTNLERAAGGGFTWRFDLAAVEAMLADYARTDAWPIVLDPPAGLSFHLVRAEASDRWPPAARELLTRAASHPRVKVHALPRAGHWLHVDNPEGLLDLLVQHLGGGEIS
jgi:pimeloyl-ACP methyl ester carboxylesterase